MSFTELELSDAIELLASASQSYSFIVGAGLSHSAGIPTGREVAEKLLRDWAINERLTTNNLETLKTEFRSRYHLQGFDYSAVMERVLPSKAARHRYIENLCGNKTPKAHCDLALIAASESNRFSTILTTNFDPLIEYALFDVLPRPPAIYYRASQVQSMLLDSFPKVLKLHGDYIYLDIANIRQEFGEEIRRALKYGVSTRGVITLGIGSDDKHLIEALEEIALDPTSLQGGLLWFASHEYDRQRFPKDLLEKVALQGKQSYLVWALGGDPVDEVLLQLRTALKLSSPVGGMSRNGQLMKTISRRLPGGMKPITKGKLDAAGPSALLTAGPLTELVESTRKDILLLGPPGSGKSTMLLWEAGQALKAGQDAGYISLSRGADEPAVSAIDLLCLDQIEVKTDISDVLTDARKIITHVQRLLCAGREESVDVLPPNHNLTIIRIEPLDDDGIREFVAQELRPELVPSFLVQVKNLTARLGTITRTPLWLMMACSIYGRGVRLPESRVEMYDEYVRWFLGPWSRPRTAKQLDDLRRIAADAALWIEDPRHVSAPDNSDLDELAATGMVSHDTSREFLHPTFQEYFCARRCIQAMHEAAASYGTNGDWDAAREQLALGLPQDILRSEVNEWMAELISVQEEERNAFIAVLKSLTSEPAPKDKREANLWYVAGLVTQGTDQLQRLILPRVQALDRDSGPRTPQSEATLFNACMAGIYLGERDCMEKFFQVCTRDFFEASWSLCPYRDAYTRVGHEKGLNWDALDGLNILHERKSQEREVMMHAGHLAQDERLEKKNDFRVAIEQLLTRAIDGGEKDFRIPMNAIIALRRINDPRSVDVILDISAKGDWRILRASMDMFGQLDPEDLPEATRDRVERFLKATPSHWASRPAYQVAVMWIRWVRACRRTGIKVSFEEPLRVLPEPYRSRLATAASWL